MITPYQGLIFWGVRFLGGLVGVWGFVGFWFWGVWFGFRFGLVWFVVWGGGFGGFLGFGGWGV